MRLHPRTLIVQEADLELGKTLFDLTKKHELTLVEVLQMLNRESATYLKYALRGERHPDDPDKGGDEE